MRLRHRALMALALLMVIPSAEAGSERALAPGKTLFWTGPRVEQSSDSWTYTVRVTKPADRLRVGVDHPEVDDSYTLQVITPIGPSLTVSSGGGLYSGEVLLEDPIAGTYKFVVQAQDATDTNFRLRAKLEQGRPSLGKKRGLVYPNLQVLPPHEASFLFPVTNGATGTDPTGADVAGVAACHPEEHGEDRAVRCLRFAYGVRNTGRGPMELYYEGGGTGVDDRVLHQRVRRAEGGYADRVAGTARFHKTHTHYHHDAAIGLQLFKVTDRNSGKVEAAGEKRTKGFAHREELLREWDTFYPTWDSFSGFGLRPGWADIYEWDRPGNYIDFGLNGDGYYVVRMSADPVGGIAESNERDNAGYTYMKITGNVVDLIEAGRGRDPWDPCKIKVGFGGHADPKQKPRPRSCSRDTT